MAKTIEARVIQKIATASEWATSDLVPYKGEVMLVSDSSGKVLNIKIGDGVNMFPDLNYMFDSIQQNVNYIPYEDTPSASMGFTLVGEGTYANGVVVDANMWAILYWDGSTWTESGSYDLPNIEIVSNLVTDDDNKALSASQGVILKEQVDQSLLPKEIDNIFNGGQEIISLSEDVSIFGGATFTNEDNILYYKKTGIGNSWMFTNSIPAVSNEKLIIEFDITFLERSPVADSGKGFTLFIAESGSAIGKFNTVTNITTGGHFYIEIDTTNYVDNLNYSTFCFWLNNQTLSSTSSVLESEISNFKVLRIKEKVIDDLTVFTGTILSEMIQNADDKIVEIESKVDDLSYLVLDDINNGELDIYAITNEMNGTAIESRDIPDDSLIYRKSGTGNSWIYTPIFYPTGNNLVKVEFDLEFIERTPTADEDKGLQIYVSENISAVAGKFTAISSVLNTDGHFERTFDPAYYTVYEGYTKFCIWLNNIALSSSSSLMRVKVKNFKVTEIVDSINFNNFSGNRLDNILTSIDNKITDISSGSTNSSTHIVSPSGNKFIISVNDDGDLLTSPVIPNLASWLGNSLFGGFTGFGMAASESSKDFYHRIKTYLESINDEYVSRRVGNQAFEDATTELAANTAINGIVAGLDGNEDLVVIQLGDNINTTAKNLVFNGDNGSCYRLIKACREKSPRARVCWLGMWYGSSEKYETITNACNKTGGIFINISDLVTSENRSRIGYITNRGSATRTLSGVSSVVDNTSTNITVNFTVSGVNYSSTLDITSYSLSGTTLTYTGIYEIISTSGVASHPGDEGFRKIANRVLFNLGITSVENTIL